jgi:hypothetical protein
MKMKKPSWRMPKWSWKKVVLAVVGALIVVSVARSLLPLGGSGDKSVDVTGEGGRPGTGVKAQQPQRTVELDGKKIPVGGGPIAVLNPGLARPGAKVGVNASGFDPGASVQVLLSTKGGKGKSVASAKADKSGVVATDFTFPVGSANEGAQVVTVQQGNGDKVAKAELVVQAGVGLLKLSDDTGAPGTTLTADAEGFLPKEKVNVYWGRISGTPSATLQADEAGRLSRAPIKVGVGAVGDNTVIMIGEQSKTAAIAPFTLLGLYPTAATKPFAAKPAQRIGISGGGFAPGERVLVYFNGASGTPGLEMQADDGGNVGGAGFKVPFGLEGQQTLVLVGEESRASVSAGFAALPYNPIARAGTYGGLPGTTINFYAKEFAPNEAVHVYLGKSQGSQGEIVAAFRVNEKGAATAAGQYMIPADAQGKLTFSLVGAKSGGTATATVTVDKPDGPVNLPPQPKYSLPPDLKE